ncbi:YqcC family protein [uncultured Gilvimarinus sp.]|uniref:YqcC family protein n=1 Tax=uncultured Gilvimarinus sp. TaxID=1689143 RepID=UPI0030EEAB96|tara:strand:- start:227 stop:547 length:321 start_codon:yes stop_codon:yes gene_type:complete
MTDKHIAVADILLDLEAALRELNLWHSEPPSAEALASTAPFAVDTLTFTQWLQFMFLPRMHTLVTGRGTLPVNCAIAPMAEEYFRPQSLDASAVLVQLQRIDTLLS